MATIEQRVSALEEMEYGPEGYYTSKYSGEEIDALLALTGFVSGDVDLNRLFAGIDETKANAESSAQDAASAKADAATAEEAAASAQDDAAAANESATNAARSATEAALDASQAYKSRAAIEGLTVSSETLEAGESASVTKSMVYEHVNLHFGLPRGMRGEQGTVGPQGPQGIQGPQGPQGAAGVSVATEGQYVFHVDEDGNLILDYTGDTAPGFEINEDGDLILTID